MSLDIDHLRKNSMMARDGFYHVVGNHYCLREVDFEVLAAEVEHLRGERAAVVAHLRERAIHGAGNIVSVEDACTILADLFERGEHRREEGP